MSKNSTRSENELNPSDKYLRDEIEKIKVELNQLKNLKDQTFHAAKSSSRRKPVKRAVVRRKTVARRKPVKRAVVRRKTVARRK